MTEPSPCHHLASAGSADSDLEVRLGVIDPIDPIDCSTLDKEELPFSIPQLFLSLRGCSTIVPLRNELDSDAFERVQPRGLRLGCARWRR